MGEIFEQLVIFAEFAGAAGLVPELLGLGVHHAVLVIDRHAEGAIGWQGIDNERLGCPLEHVFADIDIGAKRIPARGVIADVVVVAFDNQIVICPGLIADTIDQRFGCQIASRWLVPQWIGQWFNVNKLVLHGIHLRWPCDGGGAWTGSFSRSK